MSNHSSLTFGSWVAKTQVFERKKVLPQNPRSPPIADKSKPSHETARPWRKSHFQIENNKSLAADEHGCEAAAS